MMERMLPFHSGIVVNEQPVDTFKRPVFPLLLLH